MILFCNLIYKFEEKIISVTIITIIIKRFKFILLNLLIFNNFCNSVLLIVLLLFMLSYLQLLI